MMMVVVMTKVIMMVNLGPLMHQPIWNVMVMMKVIVMIMIIMTIVMDYGGLLGHDSVHTAQCPKLYSHCKLC